MTFGVTRKIEKFLQIFQTSFLKFSRKLFTKNLSPKFFSHYVEKSSQDFTKVFLKFFRVFRSQFRQNFSGIFLISFRQKFSQIFTENWSRIYLKNFQEYS